MASKSEQLETEQREKDTFVLIEQVTDEIVERDGWKGIDLYQHSQQEIEKSIESFGLENDEQTRRFTKFICVSSNFASSTFTERISRVPVLIYSIQQLLSEIRGEIKDFNEIANHFEMLTKFFCDLVDETKFKMKGVLPKMKSARNHIHVLADALEPHQDQALTDVDKIDIRTALDALANGVRKMLEFSHDTSAKSRELDQRIAALKLKVKTRRETAHNRIDFANACSVFAPIGTGSAIASALTSVVASAEFGGVGALVIAGVSLNPVGAIVLATIIGGVAVIGITVLVHHFWTKHQRKAIGFLDQICKQIIELQNVNAYFYQCLRENEIEAIQMTEHLEQILISITSNGERYQRMSASVCRDALKSTQNAIECVEKIAKIDISPWLDSERLPRFTDRTVSLPLTGNDRKILS